MIVLNGFLQITEFKEHLRTSGCTCTEPKIWISTDATAIKTAIEIDTKKNQVVGLVAPFSKETGLPQQNVFPAHRASEVSNFIGNFPMADNVYTVIATPMCNHARPYMIMTYGSDNRFPAENVKKRYVNYNLTRLVRLKKSITVAF